MPQERPDAYTWNTAYAGRWSVPGFPRSRRTSWSGTLWIIGLALAIAIAAVCYRIAEGKGRRGAASGPFLGFFFPVIALVVIFVLPDKRA